MHRLMILAMALVLSAGCYTTKIVAADETPARGDVHTEWQHTFFWGLVSPGSVNLSDFCGDRPVARIKSQVGGVGLLAYWFTGGIWTPVQVRVVCAQPKQ